jgi:hypothetical protein
MWSGFALEVAWNTVGPDVVSPVRLPRDRRAMSDGLSRVRAMVVFSNHRLGPAAELLVSPEVASAMLRETAEAARPLAQGRWEHELVLWLEDRSRNPGPAVDVSEFAWSPDNFERQRQFVTDAIERASLGSEHARAFALWAKMIVGHPRESVVVGRRWRWTGQVASI